MPAFSQHGRDFRITTPLGDDAFLVDRFVGEEATSRPYLFTIDVLSEDLSVSADSLLGKEVTFLMTVGVGDESSDRAVHGVVRSFATLGRLKRQARYRLEVVPWLWLATLRSDVRSFQKKTVPEIVTAVLEPYSTHVKDALTRTYPKRDYCVQYQETDFDFVSRLLEEEGISYSFTHTDSSVTMVLADAVSALETAWAPKAVLRLGEEHWPDSIVEWSEEHSVRTGKVTVNTYAFDVPTMDKMHTESSQSFTAYERYEYLPSFDSSSATGQRQASLRLDAHEAAKSLIRGASNTKALQAGAKIAVHDVHLDGSLRAVVQLLRVRHEGRNAFAGSDDEGSYENRFEAMTAEVAYRPPRTTPTPRVAGVHTAVVVGPAGEEIYVDAHGRVKVQFHWDRLGKKDDKSSAWVRVSSAWAGKGWGFIAHPRIGQEVLVEYVDGDPDQPVITGRVYNGDMPVPYATDTAAAQSGVRTRSTKEGGTDEFNELRFDDKKGSEEVSFQAQKDLKAVVKNDETRDVGHDRTTTIKHADTRLVSEGDDTLTVAKGSQTITISEGSQTVTVSQGNQTTTIEVGDQTLTVEGTQTVSVTGDVTHAVKTGNYAFAVDTGNHAVKVAKGNMALEVSQGNVDTKVSTGNLSTTVSLGNVVQKAAVGKQTFEATQGIELKVGANSIVIDQKGVTIKGMMVTVEGTVSAEVKGLMAKLEGSAMTTVKGAITMIN